MAPLATSDRIIDGAAFAARLRTELAAQVQHVVAAGQPRPGLAVVLVGTDPASQVYVRSKARMTREIGMHSFEHKLPAETSQAELLGLIDQLNQNTAVHGILVQLPLPAHIDAALVLNAIDVGKDVDGFHAQNAGLLATGQQGMVPCTPLGCMMLLRDGLGDLTGMKAVVVGASNIVGKPMAQLLLAEKCTVTTCHIHTRDLRAEVCTADILVVAAGKPSLIPGDWIKPGATVIDVGINRISREGRNILVGDVDFASASVVAGQITPVPGGVGPMTIACLLHNTMTAYYRQTGPRDVVVRRVG